LGGTFGVVKTIIVHLVKKIHLINQVKTQYSQYSQLYPRLPGMFEHGFGGKKKERVRSEVKPPKLGHILLLVKAKQFIEKLRIHQFAMKYKIPLGKWL